jgi:hypothetical protein
VTFFHCADEKSVLIETKPIADAGAIPAPSGSEPPPPLPPQPAAATAATAAATIERGLT